MSSPNAYVTVLKRDAKSTVFRVALSGNNGLRGWPGSTRSMVIAWLFRNGTDVSWGQGVSTADYIEHCVEPQWYRDISPMLICGINQLAFHNPVDNEEDEAELRLDMQKFMSSNSKTHAQACLQLAPAIVLEVTWSDDKIGPTFLFNESFETASYDVVKENPPYYAEQESRRLAYLSPGMRSFVEANGVYCLHPVDGTWSVSHLPTGRSIRSGLREKDARALVSLLVSKAPQCGATGTVTWGSESGHVPDELVTILGPILANY